MKHTLCWDCKWATGKKRPDGSVCRWQEKLEPVEGWVAEPTVRKEGTKDEMRSFLVLKCPEFTRDAYFGGLKRSPELTDEDAARILQEECADER